MVNVKLVKLLIGTNELAPHAHPILICEHRSWGKSGCTLWGGGRTLNVKKKLNYLSWCIHISENLRQWSLGKQAGNCKLIWFFITFLGLCFWVFHNPRSLGLVNFWSVFASLSLNNLQIAQSKRVSAPTKMIFHSLKESRPPHFSWAKSYFFCYLESHAKIQNHR